MKKALFSLIIVSVLTIFFIACPPLEEDDDVFEEGTLTYEGILDYQKWLEILDDVGRQKNYIRLDLKACTYVEDNEGGGLVKVTVHGYDTSGDPDPQAGDPIFIAFDPTPFIRWGKDKIVTIVLPDLTEMIAQATDKEVGTEKEKEADKKKAAFANFIRLRSVIGANVKLIGNYAFVDNKTLTDLDFPNLGMNLPVTGFELADIGPFAFKGCTNLTGKKNSTATFNSVTIIGKHAFEDCTKLEVINFPNVTKIEDSAFAGCETLKEVRFELAEEVGEEAFLECTALEEVFFPATPATFNVNVKAFSGCTALKSLDIRNATNVFFGEGALESIGTNLELYLNGASSHTQTELFLGEKGDTFSLTKMEIHVPEGATENIDTGIAQYVRDTYSITVSVTQ